MTIFGREWEIHYWGYVAGIAMILYGIYWFIRGA